MPSSTDLLIGYTLDGIYMCYHCYSHEVWLEGAPERPWGEVRAELLDLPINQSCAWCEEQLGFDEL